MMIRIDLRISFKVLRCDWPWQACILEELAAGVYEDKTARGSATQQHPLRASHDRVHSIHSISALAMWPMLLFLGLIQTFKCAGPGGALSEPLIDCYAWPFGQILPDHWIRAF